MINLKQMYGDRFKITFDEGLEIRNDPWMMQIPCKKGVIYVHGEETLAVECKVHTAKRLQGVRIHQQGDLEWTLLFWPDQFEEVVKIVEPRKRRKLSESEKERLKEYWFKKK